jgi:hypothetical protein
MLAGGMSRKGPHAPNAREFSEGTCTLPHELTPAFMVAAPQVKMTR